MKIIGNLFCCYQYQSDYLILTLSYTHRQDLLSKHERLIIETLRYLITFKLHVQILSKQCQLTQFTVTYFSSPSLPFIQSLYCCYSEVEVNSRFCSKSMKLQQQLCKWFASGQLHFSICPYRIPYHFFHVFVFVFVCRFLVFRYLIFCSGM